MSGVPLDVIQSFEKNFRKLAEESFKRYEEGPRCMSDWHEGRAKAYVIAAETFKDLAEIFKEN